MSEQISVITKRPHVFAGRRYGVGDRYQIVEREHCAARDYANVLVACGLVAVVPTSESTEKREARPRKAARS
jgi:hypothetical protein